MGKSKTKESRSTVKVPKPPQRTPITSPNTDSKAGSTDVNATSDQEEREYEQGEAGINKDEMGIVKRLITAFKDTVDTSNRTITELIERTSKKEEKETTFLRTPLRAKSARLGHKRRSKILREGYQVPV